MNSDKKNICKNYDIIVNCEFLEDDLFSNKLVDFYKNAVVRSSNDESNLKKLKKFDKVMRRYIEDYSFSKKLSNSVDVSSIVMSKVDLTYAVLEYASDFLDKYDETDNDAIVNTRWI